MFFYHAHQPKTMLRLLIPNPVILDESHPQFLVFLNDVNPEFRVVLIIILPVGHETITNQNEENMMVNDYLKKKLLEMGLQNVAPLRPYVLDLHDTLYL